MVWGRSDIPPPPLSPWERAVRRVRYRLSAWAEKLERVFQGM